MIKGDNILKDVIKLHALNEDRINSLVQQRWKRLDELLSPELIFIHSSGRCESKANYIRSLMEGKLRYIAIDMPNPEVSVLDDTVAVVRGPLRTEIVSKGQTRVLRSFAHMTWTRNKQDSWHLLSYSSTPLA